MPLFIGHSAHFLINWSLFLQYFPYFPFFAYFANVRNFFLYVYFSKFYACACVCAINKKRRLLLLFLRQTIPSLLLTVWSTEEVIAIGSFGWITAEVNFLAWPFSVLAIASFSVLNRQAVLSIPADRERVLEKNEFGPLFAQNFTPFLRFSPKP